MEAFLKLFRAAGDMTFDAIFKGIVVVAFFLWAFTEGREVWLDEKSVEVEAAQTQQNKTIQATNELNRDLLVSTVTKLEQVLEQDKIQNSDISSNRDSFIQASQTQQLMQLKYDMEIQNIKEDLEDL